MRLAVPLLALAALSPAPALSAADGEFFPVWNQEGKEGYIDGRGHVVIEPQFDQATGFSEGLAAVRVGEKWDYIDRTGALVIAPRWTSNDRSIPAASPFKEGIALVVEYATWAEDGDAYACGYIDASGAYIVEPQLRRECRSFSDGLAWVVTDKRGKDGARTEKDSLDRGGYIDRAGRWAIGPGLYRAGDFVNGVARVRKYSYPEETWYFIDRQGRRIADPEALERQAAAAGEAISKAALVLKLLKVRTISERPASRNIYGYENANGKYVWLSPGAEEHLGEGWIRENVRRP